MEFCSARPVSSSLGEAGATPRVGWASRGLAVTDVRQRRRGHCFNPRRPPTSGKGMIRAASPVTPALGPIHLRERWLDQAVFNPLQDAAKIECKHWPCP